MAKEGAAPTPTPAKAQASPGVVDFGAIEKNLGLTGADSSVRPPPPTYRELVVVQMASWVGIAIVAMTLMLIAEWIWHSPPSPTSADLKGAATNLADNAENARKLVDNYKTLADVATDRSIKVFDSFVGKAFLPVFTTLIGYIIGARSTKDG